MPNVITPLQRSVRLLAIRRIIYLIFCVAYLQALVSCWSEAEFMHNKNAIVVGLQVIKYFPVMDTNGKAIEGAIKKLHAGENGEITNDLKLLSTS